MPKKQEIFSVKLKSPDTVVLDGTFELKEEAFYEAFKNAAKVGLTKEQFFERALRLGIYGCMEERIGAFLRHAEHDLDYGMEKLKLIFKLREEREKSTAKGAIAEQEIQDVLREFILENKWSDKISGAGSDIGAITDRKVGDIIVEIGDSGKKVTIESKMDKAVHLGDLLTSDYRNSKKPVEAAEKTAYGQLLLSLANRDAQIALIVFDRANCSPSISALKQDVTFFPEIPGWVVRIGKAENDFGPLRLAYSIARLQAISVERVSGEHLDLAVKRMLRDLVEMNKLEELLKKIKDGAEKSLEGVSEIEKMMFQTKQSIVRTQEILNKILGGVAPSAEEWADFFKESAPMV